MKNNFKDNDVVEYKIIIGVFSCVAFNILLLITIAIIYRRRKKHYSSNVCSMEMINLNIEHEVNDEKVDVFNTVLPR
jgi:cbb3-type cytochrome oxidase subunit 3